MDKQLTEILINEIRENREQIRLMRHEVAKIDKSVLANTLKLSGFIGGISLFFSLTWAVLIDRLKQFI